MLDQQIALEIRRYVTLTTGMSESFGQVKRLSCRLIEPYRSRSMSTNRSSGIEFYFLQVKGLYPLVAEEGRRFIDKSMSYQIALAPRHFIGSGPRCLGDKSNRRHVPKLVECHIYWNFISKPLYRYINKVTHLATDSSGHPGTAGDRSVGHAA